MKKGLIFATSLALVLGVGAAVGARHAQDLSVKAAGATLYLDTNHLDWYLAWSSINSCHRKYLQS